MHALPDMAHRSLPKTIACGTPDASRCIEIGLVNNMPDSALKGTERQFMQLLTNAAGDRPVRLHLFTLPEVPRSERARRHLDESYGSLDDLLSSRLDALIVTGAEPRTARLRDEPYWASLTTVFDWAAANTKSTILSCLAAHAAVLHFDGIARTPLARKCLGVFDHVRTSEHALTSGGPASWRVPHSRWNELSEAALAARGYEMLSRSAQSGVDLFTRQLGCQFVFLQGHPEYERDTLLKEYQRDIRRFLTGERDAYPTMPSGYFDDRASDLLRCFETRARADRRADVMDRFPSGLLSETATPPWSAVADCIYRNWLRTIAAEKAAPAGRASRAREPALHV